MVPIICFTLYSQFLHPFGMRSVTVFEPCEELQQELQKGKAGNRHSWPLQ